MHKNKGRFRGSRQAEERFVFIEGEELTIRYDSITGEVAALPRGASGWEPPVDPSSPPVPMNTLPRLTLHLTNDCTLQCKYCYNPESDSISYMSPDTALRAVSGAVSAYGHIDYIVFFGGEPFLNVEAIERTCTFVRNNALGCGLIAISNMTANLDSMIRLVDEFGIRVTASVDIPQDVHDRQRPYANGTGSFDVVDSNLRRLRTATDQPSTVECTYTSLHEEAGLSRGMIVELVRQRYGQDLQVRVVRASYSPATGLSPSHARPFSNLIEFVRGKRPAEAYHDELELAEKLLWRQTPSLRFCDAGIASLTVSPEGSLYPCSMFLGEPDYCMGVADEGGFARVRETQMADVMMPQNLKRNVGQCRNCWVRSACTGCPGAAFRLCGTPAPATIQDCDRLRRLARQILHNIADMTPAEYEVLYGRYCNYSCPEYLYEPS